MTPRSAAPRQRYVAFLRAINVGGHVVKMDRLRAEFEALRLHDVETFIASGNVLFSAPSLDTAELEARIERRLATSLGYAVATFLRTPEELATLVRDDPFAQRDSTAQLWVGFLKTTASPAIRDKVLAFRTDLDEFEVRGREAYWMYRAAKMSDSKVSGAKLEKALAMPATFRNVTTVRKLADRLTAERG
jgi:uncharacterized protein (DUF1697 family)